MNSQFPDNSKILHYLNKCPLLCKFTLDNLNLIWQSLTSQSRLASKVWRTIMKLFLERIVTRCIYCCNPPSIFCWLHCLHFSPELTYNLHREPEGFGTFGVIFKGKLAFEHCNISGWQKCWWVHRFYEPVSLKKYSLHQSQIPCNN